MRKRLNICKGLLAMCLSWGALSGVAMAAADPWQMNMYKGVTPLSEDIYDLHMLALAVCAAIGIVVFGVMFYALIYHRKSKGHTAAQFHDNFKLEIVWTTIPFLILIALAVPATKTLIRMEDNTESDVTIKVVGYQWRWEYQYLDQGIRFFSNLSTPYAQITNQEPKGEWYLLEVDNPVVVPVGKKIRFLVTSNDVIHSWWVPELGIKRDAVPGFTYESWARIEKPGVYRGQCAELCGVNHAYMPIVVKAVPQEEFNTWVQGQPKADSPYQEHQPAEPIVHRTLEAGELMKLGKQKYEIFCLACHKSDGTGIPPMFPALKGSSVSTGHPISRHIKMVLDGVPGSAMQAYRAQLSDEEVAAIVTYERNAWENNTGDVVQPADVAEVRRSSTQKPIIVKKAQAGGFQ